MNVIIAGTFFGICFLIVELIQRKFKVKSETTRKIMHIVSGTVVAILPIWLSLEEIAVLAFVFMLLLIISKSLSLLGSIHNVKRKTLGEVYFCIGILTTALVYDEILVFSYGVLIMALADGFASIVGERYGSTKLINNKSLQGSITFFLISLALSICFISFIEIDLLFVILFSLVFSALLTILELLLGYGLDNLALPPLAASMMLILI